MNACLQSAERKSHNVWITIQRTLIPRLGLTLVASAVLAVASAQGANLLVNPGFEANSGHNLPVGWTYFEPPPTNSFGDYWIESAVTAHAGTFYWKQWGTLYSTAVNNVAGIYQNFSSAPGSVYQASGWFYTRTSDLMGADCQVWLEVAFLDGSGAQLALYKSDVFSAGVGADAWWQYAVTNVCDLSSPVSTGDPYYPTYAVTGSVSQLVAPLGTAKVRYRFAYLQSLNQGGSCYLDDAVLDQVSGPRPPVISDVSPLNMIFVNPADGILFNASSPSGYAINNSGIQLIVNGTNVSGSLVIGGVPSNRSVAYHGLQSNTVYNASITVTDTFGFSASATTYFETTWVGIPPIVYAWEAEDFDFTNGLYFNTPLLCDTPDMPNCYFGKVGVQDADEHNASPGTYHLYRPDDLMGTTVSGDYLRKDHVQAAVQDYRIDPFQGGEWLNYTRDWPTGTYWVIARLSTDIGLSGTLTLSEVNPDSSTTLLGTFTVANGRGWSAYDNVFLRDTNGNIANITFSGHKTLRVASGGYLLPNFFAVVAGTVDLPILSSIYPTGTRPFEYTNALAFTLATAGATFPASSIKLYLDGQDVSSSLVVSGPASTKTAVYPALQVNAIHTAIITATNSLGHGIAFTNHFDTFSEDNYMVEAEDFDFDGGQFIPADSWTPDGYFGRGALTNVDFQHNFINGEQFAYRSDGIPEEIAHDYLRQSFVLWGAIDYHLAWFGYPDWANYTRVYPTSAFYVYGRFAGSGGYSMYLDQVTSGAGTTTQTTTRLGRWGAVGRDWQAHDWVPLTDDGLAAPIIVNLNGQTTLRISTTGNCNPSYFMLVPAAGIRLGATLSGANVMLSFPTQVGLNYRVFKRNDLSSGNWTALTSVLGDGTTKSISDPATGTRQFYKIVSP